MLVVRGLYSFTSISLLYTSVQLMPLSDAVVLQFLSPLMVAVAAPLLLKELPSRCASAVLVSIQSSSMHLLYCPAIIAFAVSALVYNRMNCVLAGGYGFVFQCVWLGSC